MTTTKIRCAVVDKEKVRCPTVFETTEQCSPNARFICKNHQKSAQLLAAGRLFDPVRDSRDEDARFQDVQHDSDLSFHSGSSIPIGTEHVPNSRGVKNG